MHSAYTVAPRTMKSFCALSCIAGYKLDYALHELYYCEWILLGEWQCFLSSAVMVK